MTTLSMREESGNTTIYYPDSGKGNIFPIPIYSGLLKTVQKWQSTNEK